MKRAWFVLVLVVLGAGALRVWGLDYGLPHPLSRPDEERIVGRAQTIFATGDWHPGSFYYPSLLFYVDTGALWAYYGVKKMLGDYERPFDFLFEIAVTRPGLHYLIARYVGAVAGTLTVIVTFFLASTRAAGLLAAVLIAACHLHVRESHFATVDIVMTLFVALSLCFAVRAATKPSWRSFLLAGLTAGLAASTKYNAGVVALAIVTAALTAPLDTKSKLSRVGAAGVVAVLAFATTSPFVLLRFRGFLANMGGLEGFLYERDAPLALWQHLDTTLPHGLGWPLAIAAALGVARAIVKRRPSDLVLLSFLVPYFVLVSGVRVTFPRYIVPLVPPLIVLASDFTAALMARFGSRLAWAGVATLLVLPTLVDAVRYDRLAAERDTRLLATDYVAANVAPQSRIVVCAGYGAPAVNTDRRRPPAFVVEDVDCTKPPRDEGAYVVTHAHEELGVFSGLHPEWTRYLDDRAELIHESSPYRAGAAIEPVFYKADAFYIPFAGFGAVERGGPIVQIWKLRKSSR